MKLLALALALFSTAAIAGVSYSTTFDVYRGASGIAVASASYRNLPVKTEVRPVPGCYTYGDRAPSDCEEVVILETVPVIQVVVSYDDPRENRDNYPSTSSVAVNFKLSDFSPEEIAEFKAARFSWRRPFSTTQIRLGRKYFGVSVKQVQRTIMVVDEENSTFCQHYGDNYPDPIPGCVPNTVFKRAVIWVKEVTVSRK
jgi:hypothetical protein